MAPFKVSAVLGGKAMHANRISIMAKCGECGRQFNIDDAQRV